MIHQPKELCFVFIGGPMSMETVIAQTDLHPSQVYQSLLESQYVCGEIIELQSPNRLVAVRAFADRCSSIRQAIFQQAVEFSRLVKTTGDVNIAMFLYIESQTNWKVSEIGPLQELSNLSDTIQRLSQSSKLVMRQVTQYHKTSLLTGK